MITRLLNPTDEWHHLRKLLWPETSEAEHRSEMAEFAADSRRFAQFIAHGPAGEAMGFAEAAVRSDYVNGTESSPVVFLEGLYVVPTQRHGGVARQLVTAVAAWAGEQGIRELASDTELDNLTSQAVHEALGFVETERVVYYRKLLDQPCR